MVQRRKGHVWSQTQLPGFMFAFVPGVSQVLVASVPHVLADAPLYSVPLFRQYLPAKFVLPKPKLGTKVLQL